MTEELILESNRQFQAAWKFFADRIPGGECTELIGVTAVFSNIPISFFNLILLSSPADSKEALSTRLKGGLEFASSSPHPWMFSLCEEWLPEGWEGVCREMGLTAVLRLEGMAADRLREPLRSQPELEFRRVKTESDILQIARINAQAYGMPAEAAQSMTSPSIWGEDAYGFLGLRRGSATAAAATFVVDRRLYVGWVATLPEHQRMGYGEAVMRRSLEQAQAETGLRRTILHATPAGAPLYRQMGYQTVAGFTLYSPVSPPAEPAE